MIAVAVAVVIAVEEVVVVIDYKLETDTELHEKIALRLHQGLSPDDTREWSQLNDDERLMYRSAVGIVIERINKRLQEQKLSISPDSNIQVAVNGKIAVNTDIVKTSN